MGSKSDPGKFDCYANALPDEPMFVLLARDPLAPSLIEDWAADRMRAVMMKMRPLKDLEMVDEAQRCAKSMRDWRKTNDGKWRDLASTDGVG